MGVLRKSFKENTRLEKCVSKIEMYEDTMFDEKYFDGDVYYISNIKFNKVMNESLGKLFNTISDREVHVFCSKELPGIDCSSKEVMIAEQSWCKNSEVTHYVLNGKKKRGKKKRKGRRRWKIANQLISSNLLGYGMTSRVINGTRKKGQNLET